MKITIYVNEKYLENLYKFLGDGQERPIEWYHDRPGIGVYYMVTIDYNDFVRMEELSE
jgi:hypothetical protein